MQKFLKDLICSPVEPGKASHTRLWSNIGMAAMTAVFLWYGFTSALPEWYVWVYAPTVVAPHLLSDLINLRWGLSSAPRTKDTPEEDSK